MPTRLCEIPGILVFPCKYFEPLWQNVCGSIILAFDFFGKLSFSDSLVIHALNLSNLAKTCMVLLALSVSLPASMSSNFMSMFIFCDKNVVCCQRYCVARLLP